MAMRSAVYADPPYQCYESACCAACYTQVSGMIGIDEGGWNWVASREAPSSINQRTKTSANRTNYAALPLAA